MVLIKFKFKDARFEENGILYNGYAIYAVCDDLPPSLLGHISRKPGSSQAHPIWRYWTASGVYQGTTTTRRDAAVRLREEGLLS